MKKTVLMLVVGMFVAAGTGLAQGGVDHPGYYPIEEMGILAQSDLEVDVDLQGAMLQVVAGAIQNDENDPDLAALVSNLDRVRVQVGSPERVDQSSLEFAFQDAIANMESAGWYRILRVLEEDEQVYLYAREIDGRIVGLTVLVNDGSEETVLVNIVGDIDPVVLGKSLSKLNNLKNFEHYINDDE